MKQFILIIFFSFFSKCLFSQERIVQIDTFINQWIGKPYRFGGTTKNGVDCSALVKNFYQFAFNLIIPRTCVQQWEKRKEILFEDLQMGDIIFFKSKYSPSGWHCGLYIGNNKFFHASNKKEGVKISDLSDPYYKKTYKGAGRFDF